MALDKFYWRCEGTTLDGTHDFTAGDSTAVLNSTAAINADGALVGTNGLDCPSSNDYAQFVVSAGDIIGSSEGSLAFKFRIVAHAPAQTLFRAYNSASINSHIKVASIGTDDATGREIEFRIRRTGGANVAISTTAADLALNTEYAALARWHETNGDMRLEIYNADGSLRTSVENLASGFQSPTSIDTLLFGVSEGVGSPDYHLDNLMISSTYGEPLEDNLDIDSYTNYGGGGGGVTPNSRLSLLRAGL